MTTKPKGVMIVGMDMPECCNKCPLKTMFKAVLNDVSVCMLTGFNIPFYVESSELRTFPTWCPLQEVK